MSPPSLLKVPPELLDRDRLPELLDLLRDAVGAEVAAELSGHPRLATPVLQLLAAASRDGVRLVLTGAPPPLVAAIGLLGLRDALPLAEEAA